MTTDQMIPAHDPAAWGDEPPATTATRMLEMAATTADQLVADAQAQADRTLAAARAEADAVLAALAEERATVEAQIRSLRQREDELRGGLRALLTDQLAQLESPIAPDGR